ncbi:MAG TPA: redox-regulated ATPase YchF [Candidatus Saccharimonadales bacterium]|nr:redox-regulated ATPase YchF [Candidatus Saccharimonadales bacterium]
MSKSLEIGIVGLPNVGKSTLFNSLTNNNVLIANYPFATIEPNTGIVPVPDERLNKLAVLYSSKKVVPATVTFVDIAGLVSGASKGEGLGNQFLGNIKACNAIVHVVRAFKDNDIVHVNNDVKPKKDIEIINTELVLADLQTITNHLKKLEKEARINPKLQPKLNTVKSALEILDNNELLSSDTNLDKDLLVDLQLLTVKPVIYVFNVDEEGLVDNKMKNYLKELVDPAPSLLICAKLEYELKALSEEEASELLESYGQEKSGLFRMSKLAYNVLGLQSFLTAGEKETRAWTIPQGNTAQQAAGVIHTDFARGFIAAEIINYFDLIKYGSLASARAAGKVRTEGKDYVMQPDDVVEFRFNV